VGYRAVLKQLVSRGRKRSKKNKTTKFEKERRDVE
jgi:hypothetical protein